jgi:hypothetical protein
VRNRPFVCATEGEKERGRSRKKWFLAPSLLLISSAARGMKVQAIHRTVQCKSISRILINQLADDSSRAV